MSSRVTRSATKLAAAAESSSAAASPANTSAAAQPLPKSRKRKTPPDRDPSPDNTLDTNNPTPRRAKKQKVAAEALSTPTLPKSRRRGAHQPDTMAKPGCVNHTSSENTLLILDSSSSEITGEKEKSPPAIPDTSRRKSSRSKKSTQGLAHQLSG